MKTPLKKFNILAEEIEKSLISEGLFSKKKHKLIDEFNNMLPVALEKVKRGFTNFCGNNVPGELKIDGDPTIQKHDERFTKSTDLLQNI